MAEKKFKFKNKIKKTPLSSAQSKVSSSNTHQLQNSNNLESLNQSQDLTSPYLAGPAYALAAFDYPSDDETKKYYPEQDNSESGNVTETEHKISNADDGEPIPPMQRRVFEKRFGRDLSHIRIHKGKTANDTTSDLSALAFTNRNHIWLGPQTNPSDTRMMAHEITHVIQQGHAPSLQARNAISLGHSALSKPNSMQAANSSIALNSSQGSNVTSQTSSVASQGVTVQRTGIWDSALSLGGRAVSTIRGGARYIRNEAGELIEAGTDYFIGLAEEWAPGLVEFLRSDILTVIKEKIVSALSDRFSRLLAGINISALISGLTNFFTDFIQEFMDAKQGLTKKTCSGIQRAAKKLVRFVKDIGTSAFKELKEKFGDLKQFFTDAWSDIAPGIESIKTYAGEVWTEITDQATELWDMTEPLRQEISDGWDWIKETFDIAWTSSQSVLGWLSDKASEALELAKEILQPIITHLKAVAMVLAMLTPLGPILLIKEAASYFWDKIKELAEKVNIGEWIVQAYSFVANELLPMIRSGIEMVKSLLTIAQTVITTMVSALVSVVKVVLDIMGITPVLRLARDVIMQLWANLVIISHLFSVLWNTLVSEAKKVLSELWEKLKPILKTLTGIIALVTNPMNWIIFATGLVVNLVWYLIPDCLKKPLVEFLLDLAIDFVRVVEPPGTYAYTWDVIQAGLLGFLQRLRSRGPDQIIQFIEKIIIVVITPSFYSGFTLGIIKGLIWDSIIGFFIAIYNLITAIPSAIAAVFRFFLSLGFDFEAIEALIQRALDIKDQVLAFINSPDALQQIVQFIRRTPSILIGMIETAVEEAADWAQRTGERLADAALNFAVTKSAFDIGMSLGTITGILLFEVLLFIFTGSIGNIVKWGGKALGWLSKGVRWLTRGLRQGTGLIARAFRMMKRITDAGFSIARRIAGRLRPIIQRMKTLFDDLILWLKNAVARAFAGMPAVRRFAERQIEWAAFRFELWVQLSPGRFNGLGMPRSLASTILNTTAHRYHGLVIAIPPPANIEEDGGFWVLKAIKLSVLSMVLNPLGREVARVPMDGDTRMGKGSEAVINAVAPLRDNDDLDITTLENAIRPLKDRYVFKELRVDTDDQEQKWNIVGEMHEVRQITQVAFPGTESNQEWPEGTEDDPIPIKWFKEETDYPTIDGNTPTQGVILPSLGSGSSVDINLTLNLSNISMTGRVLQTTGDTTRSNSAKVGTRLKKLEENFPAGHANRREVVYNGTTLSRSQNEYEIDHVWDLNWGLGPSGDNFQNLWPAKTSVNSAFNANNTQRARALKEVNNEMVPETHTAQDWGREYNKHFWIADQRAVPARAREPEGGTPMNDGSHSIPKRRPPNH